MQETYLKAFKHYTKMSLLWIWRFLSINIPDQTFFHLMNKTSALIYPRLHWRCLHMMSVHKTLSNDCRNHLSGSKKSYENIHIWEYYLHCIAAYRSSNVSINFYLGSDYQHRRAWYGYMIHLDATCRGKSTESFAQKACYLMRALWMHCNYTMNRQSFGMDIVCRCFALTRIFSAQKKYPLPTIMTQFHKSALPFGIGADQELVICLIWTSCAISSLLCIRGICSIFIECLHYDQIRQQYLQDYAADQRH